MSTNVLIFLLAIVVGMVTVVIHGENRNGYPYTSEAS